MLNLRCAFVETLLGLPVSGQNYETFSLRITFYTMFALQ